MASADANSQLQRLAAVLFAAIVLLTVGVLALTQELRSRPDVVNSIKIAKRLSPDGAKIRFDLTRDEQEATISLVHRGTGEVVARPIDGSPLQAGTITTVWDGADPFGTEAPPGCYKVRFTLAEQDRDAFMPGLIGVGRECR